MVFTKQKTERKSRRKANKHKKYGLMHGAGVRGNVHGARGVRVSVAGKELEYSMAMTRVEEQRRLKHVREFKRIYAFPSHEDLLANGTWETNDPVHIEIDVICTDTLCDVEITVDDCTVYLARAFYDPDLVDLELYSLLYVVIPTIFGA